MLRGAERLLVIVVMNVAVIFSGAAAAHGAEDIEDVPAGMVKAQLTALPDIEGLQVIVLDGAPQGLMMTYRGNQELTLSGRQGEPFLRFKNGEVMANRQSSTWQAAKSGSSNTDGNVGPEWQLVSVSGSYSWMDPRLTSEQVPGDPGQRQELTGWAIPLTTAGERLQAVAGKLYWYPFNVADSH